MSSHDEDERETLSADSLDDLDHTGEEAGQTSLKKLYGLLAGVIVLILVAIFVITAWVFPGFLKSEPSAEQPNQSQQQTISDKTDQSGKYRIGDTLRVVSGGNIVNITITEFTEAGAMAEDGTGMTFEVTQNQLDRYAKDNPDMFSERLGDDDKGDVKPRLD